MITGNLKWRLQDRRRSEVVPMFMKAQKLTDDEIAALCHPMRPGPITWSAREAPIVQRIHIPQWRHPALRVRN